MLSYQHGYHAGSFADVHKHTALCLLLAHLLVKPAPFCVIDSHAGRGVYDLTGAEAMRTGEWQAGIGRLAGAEARSRGVKSYLEIVAAFNEPGGLTAYPGSPAIAARMMRADDRLVLIEAHPAEHAALGRALRRDRRVHIHRRDGFEGLAALTPPAERRGLVLIDPAYEVKTDYLTVPRALAAALKKWPGGIFAVWYPLLPDGRQAPLLAGLEALARPLLIAELLGPKPERGLIGTGLAVINPPWRFDLALAEAGDELAVRLFGAAGRHALRRVNPS